MTVEAKDCIMALREIPDNSVDSVFVNTEYAPDFYNDPRRDETRREIERVRR